MDFFGTSLGWIWGLRKGGSACSAVAALAAVWKSGSAVVAQWSGLSFNYLGFPPKKKKNIYIYIYIVYIDTVHMCIYTYVHIMYIYIYWHYIYIYTHTSYHRTGDYIHYSRFCPFFIVFIFLQTQPKSEIWIRIKKNKQVQLIVTFFAFPLRV